MTDEALFNNAHAALVFAFNFSSQCYDRPMMNRLAAPSLGSGKGLAGLDGAAQAGMIRAEVRDLGKQAEAILIARVAPRSEVCECLAPCCAGSKPNKEWIAAISLLADHVRNTALAGCTANGLMRREYVVRYFAPKGARVTFEQLSEKYDIAVNTVSAHSAKVARLFGGTRSGGKSSPGLEDVAKSAVECRFIEIGLVASA
jgi:hypothetical protein